MQPRRDLVTVTSDWSMLGRYSTNILRKVNFILFHMVHLFTYLFICVSISMFNRLLIFFITFVFYFYLMFDLQYYVSSPLTLQSPCSLNEVAFSRHLDAEMNIGLHNSESQKLESNLLSSEDLPLAFLKPAQVTCSILTLPYLAIFVGIPTLHDFCLGVVFIQRRFLRKTILNGKAGYVPQSTIQSIDPT